MKLSNSVIEEIQKKYHYLINYESQDPSEPIDPLTYVDSNGDALLHIAAQCGDIRTIQLLLEGGADVNQTGDMGCTALHYAKNTQVSSLLLAKGASMEIRNEFGQLPAK